MRPFNTLITVVTAVALYLVISVLWNANNTQVIVPFSVPPPGSRVPVSVPAEAEKILASPAHAQSTLVGGTAPATQAIDAVLSTSDKSAGTQHEPEHPAEVKAMESGPNIVPQRDESVGGFLPAVKVGELPNPLRIFLVENSGSHEEVFTALIYAFARIPNSYIYEYLFRPRFNIFAIIKPFNLLNLAKPRSTTAMKLDQKEPHPDIILSTTCEFDIFRLQPQMTEMLGNGSYLFCTIHHADRWHSQFEFNFYNSIKPWIEADRVTFLFLSSHTKRYVEEKIIPTWEAKHRVAANKFEVFVPVFPVDPSKKEEMSFSLQGNYESDRRDYQSIFERFSEFGKKNPDKPQFQQLRMHLLGHGKRPPVPQAISDRVEFNEGLEFPEFYKILSESFALLPAFASDEYYDRKASSSVPASLIAGVPIVGKRRLLDTYDYMTEDSMWLQGDDEDDMAVVSRILAMSKQDIDAQKTRTRSRNREVIDDNIKKALLWARSIEYRVNRTGVEPLKEGWSWEW
ncbi:hypothetical protein V1525DRAFT_391915 [Lipomyces kononenkoae]|uniref:Uncharacterized protein n=1 Tax=Lipomyces kononenkoae TaxID=34357 RepID=A0ACC3SQV5_LIPKO